MRASIIDRLTIEDILRLACVKPNRRGYFMCPEHADDRPSAHVVPNGKGWRCFACGAKGGILDAAVSFGLANTRAEAAQYLEWKVA